jgi:hypothetical protein
MSQDAEKDQRVKIAVLDTGVCSNHPTMEKHQNRLKDLRNFVDGQGGVKDDHGHGTLTTSLLLRVAPKAEVYVAKVWDDKRKVVDAKAVAEVGARIGTTSKIC